ncbi:hypothetical protein ACQR3P_10830 [Rhodococcus sp. IEGM1300]
MPYIPSTVSDDLLMQLVTGPSVREVASYALSQELGIAYPGLNINPALAMVVTPTWNITEGHVTAGIARFESLTDALVRLSQSAKIANYIDGEHFLTLQPHAIPAIHLPVKIDVIARMINRLIPQLFLIYQEQQLDYWSESADDTKPRWHKLSNSLRNLWNTEQISDWDADQKAMARAVFENPDLTTRKLDDKYQTQACLIDIDEAEDHLWNLEVAVLVGTLGDRTLVITHSVIEGFRHFDSLQSFSETLPQRIAPTSTAHELRWHLYEPTGNFFDHQACAIITLEVDAIGLLSETISTQTPSARINATAENFNELNQEPESNFSRIQQWIPDWMLDAKTEDLSRYSRHLMDLASLREKQAGKSFLDDIPPLPTFTLQALRDRVTKDHPEALGIALENIEITIVSPVILGTIAIPGAIDTVTLSLTDLALQNLIAVPLGNKSVRRTDGSTVEQWMTPAYLEKLITDVNVGEAYPALIKNKLLANAAETQRREALFSSHLSIELPLQALQLKIRGEAGIDDQGYQYVVAAMQNKVTDRYVSGQEIVIRPLAFIPGGGTGDNADEVANMFIIGPRHADQGPCLLFRPMLLPALLQYPCETNLLYAIKHNQLLRQSVLAWLPDNVRFNYSQYVFPGQLPSAWTLTQWLVDSTSTSALMGDARLAETPLAQPSLSTMFTANANALITLADRQSVSNAQSRWATLKQGAWMLLNIALPFMGRAAMTTAWIWQIMDDLHEANEGNEKGDTEHTWSALTDLLLSLSIVLAHHAAARHKSPSRALEKALDALSENTVTQSPRKITIVQQSSVTDQPLAATHETSLYAKGALLRSSLGDTLDGLAIPKPRGLSSPSLLAGPHQHLSTLNSRWYAQVGQRWFEVMLTDQDYVQLIDTRKTPSRTGPLLTHSAAGEWFIDTRLRLRGGGRTRKDIARENEQRKTELKHQLSIFDSNREVMTAELKTAEEAFGALTSEIDNPTAQQLTRTLQLQITAYGIYIDQLKGYNALESIPNYRAVLVNCIDSELLLIKKWFTLQNSDFGSTLLRSLAFLDNKPTGTTQTARQTHQYSIDLTQEVIVKSEFALARIEEMKRLGRESTEIAKEYIKMASRYVVPDLKLLQINLAQELCIVEADGIATGAAHETLVNLVSDAVITIQSSMNLANESYALALSERIDGLSDLVDQFANIDQRILDLPGEYTGQLLQPSLDLMRQRIEAFNQQTVKYLAGLLYERKTVEPTPGPSRPSVLPQRLIKTRFKGTVVGKPRVRANVTDTDLVDVTSPLTGKIIATFHEKTPGMWVEHVSPKSRTPVTHRATLNTSMKNGETLLEQLTAFTRRTESHSRIAHRIPWEIEEMFHQQANRMEAAAQAIDKALIDENATDTGPKSANDVIKQLTDGAAELYKKGRDIRISMTKQQPPTAGRLVWLHGKNLVKISKSAKRQHLKGLRKDFMDEYEIRDKATSEVLWYAHFHYPKENTPIGSFTKAHLKTAKQRMLGGAFEPGAIASELQSIAIYRAEINHRLATSLFFN